MDESQTEQPVHPGPVRLESADFGLARLPPRQATYPGSERYACTTSLGSWRKLYQCSCSITNVVKISDYRGGGQTIDAKQIPAAAFQPPAKPLQSHQSCHER